MLKNKDLPETIPSEVKRQYKCRVLECRLKAGIATKKELALRSGIPATIISDLESGKLFLSSPYALRLSEVFKCQLDDLYELLSKHD